MLKTYTHDQIKTYYTHDQIPDWPQKTYHSGSDMMNKILLYYQNVTTIIPIIPVKFGMGFM